MIGLKIMKEIFNVNLNFNKKFNIKIKVDQFGERQN